MSKHIQIIIDIEVEKDVDVSVINNSLLGKFRERLGKPYPFKSLIMLFGYICKRPFILESYIPLEGATDVFTYREQTREEQLEENGANPDKKP